MRAVMAIVVHSIRSAPEGSMARTCASWARAARLSASHAAILCALALPATAALSDLTELPLDQLLDVEVVGASRYAQRAADAPASVTVITAADIRALGYRSLAEVLQGVRSFYTTNDRMYRYVGVRGFAPPGDFDTRLLVMVDGYRINDAVYDSGTIGNDFPVDIELIERIEIMRGPSSSIYGSNALLDMVNVITRRGADLNGFEVGADTGSYRTRHARVAFGKRFENGVDLVLSASGLDSPGPTLSFPEFSYLGGGGIAHGTDSERYTRYFGKVGYGGFSLIAAQNRRRKGVLAGAFGYTFDDPRNLADDNMRLVELSWYRESGERQYQARLFRGEYEYLSSVRYREAPEVLSRDNATAKWWGAELKAIDTGFARHKIVAGLEYQSNFRQDQAAYDLQPYFSYLDDHRTSQRLGVYLQDEFALRRGWIINGGVRLDKVTGQDVNVSPRIAIIHALSEATTLKLLYGTAFRAPSVYESFYSLDGYNLPNPSLRPERVTTWESIAEHQFSSRTRVTAVVFHYRMHGLIAQEVDAGSGLQQYSNIEGTRAAGLELEADHVGDGGWRVRASFAHQRAVDGAGDALQNSPPNVAKANLIVPAFGDRMTVGIESQFLDRRRTAVDTTARTVLANLTLTWRQSKALPLLSLSFYNVLDRRYADPVLFDSSIPTRGAVVQNGRTYALKLEHRF
jgi:outer membrane receptor protein involved in Fe transport